MVIDDEGPRRMVEGAPAVGASFQVAGRQLAFVPPDDWLYSVEMGFDCNRVSL